MSRTLRAYSDNDKEVFENLPLPEAVLRALSNEAHRIDTKKLDLLKKMNRCDSAESACRLLAERLIDMFDWSHVAIYRLDYGAGMVRLVHGEHKHHDRTRTRHRRGFEGPYAQHITAGILGQVVRSGKARNIPNVDSEPAYLPGPNRDPVVSELACPIRFDPDNRVRFIINLNDDRLNAFSREDVRMLEELADEVAGTMQRISHLAFLTECFDQATDPIIATDAQLRIRKVNPAAAALLGHRTPDKAMNTCIADYFETPAVLDHLLLPNPQVGTLGELRLKPQGQDENLRQSVFVTCNDFPQSLGGFVFLARDLREMRRKVRIELLENAAYELAIETRTPLTLAMAQIERFRGSLKPADQSEVDQILKLLGRVKNTYTRLAMFNADAREKEDAFIPLSLSSELRATLTALPNEQEAKIERTIEDAPLEVLGDHNQLGTVFGVLLSVLLRSAPESEKVEVGLAAEGPNAVARFGGRLAPPENRRARRDPTAEAYRDLRMANPLLRSIMKAHGGSIAFREESASGYGNFEIRLPLRASAVTAKGVI
jgi:putative methionine-R-sulfoxide reductase with GAF domain/nitrogen-specific signal transduction histidine kinase